MKQRIKFLLTLYIIWLPLLAIQKPIFLFYHQSLANGCTLTDYLNVITHGLLLDCTTAGYLTIIPLLITYVSIWLPGEFYKKLLTGYFWLMSILIAAIFAVDIALYSFWGFRLDATLLFYLQSPADAMASVPTKLIVSQLLLFILYAIAIYKTLKHVAVPLFPKTRVRQPLIGCLVLFLFAPVLLIPIRGGVTTSTANVGMVYFSNNQFLNHAAINPCFSLLASLSKQQDFASQFDFFPEEERSAIISDLLPQQPEQPVDSLNYLKKLDRPNILIILTESFSANAVAAIQGNQVGDITPHYNRLSREGLLFTNLYANSFRTDRGIVATLNGYLAQPTTSIMKYPAKSQTLPSIAKSLVKAGYKADMLYGGDINFTNMQSYFYSSGYSRITSDRDFPLTSRLSKWGANDDITFRHLYEDISSRDHKTPWLTTFLTLSSHEPFDVPYHRLDTMGLYPNSVAFTDSCLGDFIDKMKLLPIWENTLVILISDHGFPYPTDVKNEEPRRYHIPMLWLGGVIEKPAQFTKLANQTDLAATLLSLLGLPHDEFTFSRDLFHPNYPEYAFYTYSNGFGFIDSTGISVYDNEGNRTIIEQPQIDSETRIRKGKALLQTLYDDMGAR